MAQSSGQGDPVLFIFLTFDRGARHTQRRGGFTSSQKHYKTQFPGAALRRFLVRARNRGRTRVEEGVGGPTETRHRSMRVFGLDINRERRGRTFGVARTEACTINIRRACSSPFASKSIRGRVKGPSRGCIQSSASSLAFVFVDACRRKQTNRHATYCNFSSNEDDTVAKRCRST